MRSRDDARHRSNPNRASAFSYKGPGSIQSPDHCAGEFDLTCEECGELNTHEFRSPDDLLHALQVAAFEMDRGALKRIEAEDLSGAEQEALDSAFATSAVPGSVRYRFECAVCGDRFELLADMEEGTGGWTRETKGPAQ
jgi:hypothetical protein